MFREHHYLTGDFNSASKMFLIYWDDVLVGMASCIYMPTGMMKYTWRQHRLVILPDFQGLGFGTKVNDFLAEYFIQKGQKYFIRTTHVRMNYHMNNDKRWKATSHNVLKRRTADIVRNNNRISNNTAGAHIVGDDRVAGSFEYLGYDYATKPKRVIVHDSVDDIQEFSNEVKKLKEDYYVVVVTGKPNEENEIETAMKKNGVRTEQLYYHKNGELLMKNKYLKFLS